MKRLAVVALLSLAASSAVHAQTTTRAERAMVPLIKKLELDSLAATVRGEASALDPFLADDYFEITPEGGTLTKKQALDLYKPGMFESAKEEEMKVRVYGYTAIVNAVIVAKFVGKDAARYRYTGVWVKKDGRWQQIAVQTTPEQPKK